MKLRSTLSVRAFGALIWEHPKRTTCVAGSSFGLIPACDFS